MIATLITTFIPTLTIGLRVSGAPLTVTIYSLEEEPGFCRDTMADILFRALEKWWRCTIRIETRLPLFGMTMSPECKKIILNNNDNDKDDDDNNNNNNNNNNYKWLSEIKGGDCFVSTDPNMGRTGTSWMTDWSSHSPCRVDQNVPFVRWPWNDSGNRWAVARIFGRVVRKRLKMRKILHETNHLKSTHVIYDE